MASEVGDTSAAAGAAAAAAEPAADGANSTDTATSGAGDKRNDGSHPREAMSSPARDNSTESEKRAVMPMTLEQEGVGHHRDGLNSGAKGQVGVSGGEKSEETATGSREAGAASTGPAGPAAASEPRTRMETEDGSAPTSDRLSKKRPQEEGFEKGADAAAAGAVTTESAGKDESGKGTAASGEDARGGSTQRAMVSPGTPKPMEDPLVPEVVSQDLATQEVKRARRTNSDTESPQAGRSASSVPAAAQNERAKGQGGGGDGDGGAVTAVLGNGTAQAEQRPQANGSKVEEGEKGQEREGSGPEEQNRREGAESSGHGEPSERKTGESTGEKTEEALPPKAVSAASTVVCGAAGGSPAKDIETGADEGSPKLNGGLALPSSTSPPPSESAAMQPPLPPASSADVAPTSPGSKVAGKRDAGAAAQGAAAAPSSPPSSPPLPSAPTEARAAEDPSSDGDEKMGEAGGSDSGAKSRAAEDKEERQKEAGAGRGEAKGKDREDKVEGKADRPAVAVAAPAPAPGVKRRRSSCPDHALPVARTFFDFEAVSGLERRLLPEFFTGRSASKTPEMYMQSRNYMVRSYQRMLAADPDGQPYLTGTECRRKLAGDACSILRIHDFLDRFGLINTRAGGKRPTAYQVAPPSMQLWTPTPPLAGPLPSRRASGESGSTDAAGAAAAGASSALGRESGRRGAESGASAAASGAGGVGVAGGYGNDAGAARRASQAGFGSGSGSGGGGDHDEREWHREELLVLMEAAVAHPHQWDAVAHAVGGGRTPAACMRRFLTLAVEEVVEGEDKKPAAASTTEEAGAAAAVPPGEEGAIDNAANGGSGAGAGNASEAGGVDVGGLRKRAELQRPAHLGQAVPALVLASALVSNVDPKVLQAAMSAAVDAADAIARRPVAAGATGEDARDSPLGRLIGIDDEGEGGKALERKSSRDADEEGEDVEMRDVDDGAAGVAAAAAAASGQRGSPPRKEKDPSAIANVANGGRAESGTGTPQHKVGAAGGSGGGGGGGGGGGDSGSRSMVVNPELAGAARATVLSMAGLQARELAKQEERRTEALLADLLEARVQRLETKLHCFDELDQVLNTERESLEHDRAEFLLEQARSMLAK